MAWVRALQAALLPFTLNGVYKNFLGDEGEEQVRASYRVHYERLVALKQAGKGRLVYLGITPEYLFGANATTTLEGIVLECGLQGVPSDGYRLVENALRWLAAPSSRSASNFHDRCAGGASAPSSASGAAANSRTVEPSRGETAVRSWQTWASAPFGQSAYSFFA